jgi:myo-inositol-1-phosphate synthase
VGTSPEELQAKMLEESTAQVVMEREMKINVSDTEVQKYYDDNPSKFEQPEMVRASHILLATRDPETNKDLTEEQKAAKHKKAEEVLKRAKAGMILPSWPRKTLKTQAQRTKAASISLRAGKWFRNSKRRRSP